MGTNYYSAKLLGNFRNDLRLDELIDIIHIGKSSFGWCFALHVIPERGINDITGWTQYLLNSERIIINEYNDIISYEELLNIITNRRNDTVCPWSYEMYQLNHAQPGPNNLIRHSIGGDCVGHGEGTWDYIKSEFE